MVSMYCSPSPACLMRPHISVSEMIRLHVNAPASAIGSTLLVGVWAGANTALQKERKPEVQAVRLPFAERARFSEATKRPPISRRPRKHWCPPAESNCAPTDYESAALTKHELE